MTTKTYCVVIDHDPEPDFSWLEQDCYDPRHPSYEPVYRTKAGMEAGENPLDGDWYRDPANHVALQMTAYDEDDKVLDYLGNIDFLRDSSDWCTGTFYSLAALDRAPYLQELAEEMGLSASSEDHITGGTHE